MLRMMEIKLLQMSFILGEVITSIRQILLTQLKSYQEVFLMTKIVALVI